MSSQLPRHSYSSPPLHNTLMAAPSHHDICTCTCTCTYDMHSNMCMTRAHDTCDLGRASAVRVATEGAPAQLDTVHILTQVTWPPPPTIPSPITHHPRAPHAIPSSTRSMQFSPSPSLHERSHGRALALQCTCSAPLTSFVPQFLQAVYECECCCQRRTPRFTPRRLLSRHPTFLPRTPMFAAAVARGAF